ncbi:MAG: Smr/MutS family protein [Verrucomicrobiota bacterium JB024]|nr:Smr/MutS family protein [Verrucomicrobiota bacterium JB024]
MEDDPVEVPITDQLDLHTFRPQDVGELLPAYLEAAREKGLLRVRIIHGKGTGTLRESVHARLRKLEVVTAFRLADETAGSWGATWVELRPLNK